MILCANRPIEIQFPSCTIGNNYGVATSLGFRFLRIPLSIKGCSSFFASFCTFESGDSKNAEITLQLQLQCQDKRITSEITVLCTLIWLKLRDNIRANEAYLWPCAHNSLFPFKAFSHTVEANLGQSKISFLMVRLEWKFSKTCSSCESSVLDIAARDAIASWREFILSSKVGCSMPPEPPVATYMCQWIY